MYAIIELGGRQWKVEPGTRLDVNRVTAGPGGQLPVEQILFVQDGAQTHVGRPYVQGAKVICEVLEHRLGPKVLSYHFRRRENWRKTVGHRQPLSRLVVKDIMMPGAAGGDAPAPAAAVKTLAAKPRVSKPTAGKKPVAHRAKAGPKTSKRQE